MSARVQVVLGSPWKDAVIRHLEPRSPYRPWLYVDDVRKGDSVVVVFDTEPRLVLTEVGRVDVDGAIAGLHREWVFTDAVPASQIEADLPATQALVEGDAADALIAAVTRQRFAARPEDRFGMTTAAAARALLESRGRCTGCGTAFPLDRPGAREAISARTVGAASRDWPAALCVSCVTNMRTGEFGSFVDFKFFRHPACPHCGRRRSRRIVFGMPAFPFEPPPWVDHRGCCVTSERWSCARCGHDW
ncbi:hypothetical protein MMUR_26620 [Mycolicibacterium murale]|uniref:Uncharacterized protein n=1 Tax=Mycolicibacterium murale TaxID=182220 RepID=A0A7I9WMK9_9MYCO|nr:hypothetical protein [Mycolicibacterium murale]MCV7181127.1 hypothetical protein [Mycolicibacterium murale]GFG58526.1 hypothetical protein MMUR_26620 [Mycolicibacterium murale]